MDWAALLKFFHIVSAMIFFGHLTLQAYWKVSTDRSRDVAAIAVMSDRLHRSARITGGAAFLVFATGYPIIRALGLFGGRIATANFALWGLILMFLALALWYFAMRPLEAKMANLADHAREKKENLGVEYARASGVWLTLLLANVAILVVIVYLMVVKPFG